MHSNYSESWRRLMFAMLALLALLSTALVQPAKAADYTAGVAIVDAKAVLWFQGASITQGIAHYNIAGGSQQNVVMTYNAARGRYEQVVPAAAGQTVNHSFTYTKAGLAYDTPWASSVVGPVESAVAAPVFSPPPGSYAGAQQVTVSSATSGASIQCAIDGGAMAACPSPLAINATTTVTAIATKAGMANSTTTTASYTIGADGQGQGVLDNGTTLTLWFSRAPQASWVDAHFTLNGGAQQNVRMGLAGTRYELSVPVAATGPAAISYSFTFMTAAGAQDSATFNWARTDKVATPVLTPPPGTYGSTQSVAITSATAGATLRYTVDGSQPNATSAVYTGPIAVAAPGKTIKAIAIKDGATSPVATAVYQVGAAGLVHGVIEDGATARIWNKPPATPSTNIVHYFVTTKAGVKGAQRDENMTYDGLAQRWSGPTISPIAAGSKISYFFTYTSSSGGNIDSAWFEFTLCGEEACASAVPKPVFNPAAGGKVADGTQVTLGLGAGSVAGTRIHYTLDGKLPTVASPVYSGTPLAIDSAVTITAVAIQPDGRASRPASLTFDVETVCDTQPRLCPVAAPTLSHASGTYATKIAVNMLTETTGATVHYTTDGSLPTATSPQFHGAVWFYNDPVKGDTYTLKAIATKDGRVSPVVSADYKIASNAESAWDGKTVFNIENGTGGKYRDDQIYWFIIGKDWATGQFVRADASGRLIPVTEADNTVPVPNRDKPYANYAITLAQARSIVLPPIESARIYMSVGKPVMVQINRDINGKIGYAGPNLENSTDPNLDVQFDFGEFNINRPRPASDYPGIFVNTTRVDMFGFPLKLRVTGLDGYDATVGETLKETRDELIARFLLETPSEFHALAKAPYAPHRIMAPAHATFKPEGPNAGYLDAYIDEIWNMYRSRDLVMKVGDWPTFTGRVGPDDVLTFTDRIDTYKIYGKPTTQEVMLGNGVLDDARGTTPGTDKYNKQLQLQAQICAALNRHVAEQPNDRWYDAAYFYPAGSSANWFTRFWHEHSYNGLAYGFSYDDVGGHSPSIYTPAPVSVTYTIGK